MQNYGLFSHLAVHSFSFRSNSLKQRHKTTRPEMTYSVYFAWSFFIFSFLHLLRTFNSLLDFQVELPGEVLDVSCGVDHMAAILKCR